MAFPISLQTAILSPLGKPVSTMNINAAAAIMPNASPLTCSSMQRHSQQMDSAQAHRDRSPFPPQFCEEGLAARSSKTSMKLPSPQGCLDLDVRHRSDVDSGRKRRQKLWWQCDSYGLQPLHAWHTISVFSDLRVVLGIEKREVWSPRPLWTL